MNRILSRFLFLTRFSMVMCLALHSCGCSASENANATAEDPAKPAVNGAGAVRKMLNLPLAENRKAAESGDPSAQCALGARYAQGIDVEKDWSQAMLWWGKAADQGHARSMAMLGLTLVWGDRVGRSPTDAEKTRGLDLFNKAAEANDDLGLAFLGETLFYGVESEKGETLLARDWNRAAALLSAAIRQAPNSARAEEYKKSLNCMTEAYSTVAPALVTGSDLTPGDLKGIDPRYTPDGHSAPIAYLAARYGNLGLVRHFLDTGISPNESLPPGNLTLLHGAAQAEGGYRIVLLLLDRGADPNAVSIGGKTPSNRGDGTPLHCACEAGTAAAAYYLVKHGTRLELRNSKNQTGLDALRSARFVGETVTSPTAVLSTLAEKSLNAMLAATTNTYNRALEMFDKAKDQAANPPVLDAHWIEIFNETRGYNEPVLSVNRDVNAWKKPQQDACRYLETAREQLRDAVALATSAGLGEHPTCASAKILEKQLADDATQFDAPLKDRLDMSARLKMSAFEHRRPLQGIGIMTEQSLDQLKAIKHLRTLSLDGPSINDAVLAEIATLSELEEVSLSNSKITDDGLVLLRRLTHLKKLNLSGAHITDRGMKHVKDLQLIELNLGGTMVTDASMGDIGEMPMLTVLDLSGSRVTDKGLKELTRLSHLEELNLSRTQVCGSGLEHLRKLQQLRDLDLSGTSLSDSSLVHVVRLTGIKVLDLCDTNVTISCMPILMKLTKLDLLRISPKNMAGRGERDLERELRSSAPGVSVKFPQ